MSHDARLKIASEVILLRKFVFRGTIIYKYIIFYYNARMGLLRALQSETVCIFQYIIYQIYT